MAVQSNVEPYIYIYIYMLQTLWKKSIKNFNKIVSKWIVNAMESTSLGKNLIWILQQQKEKEKEEIK